MRKKILWGEQVPGSNRVRGGHFRGIVGHPDYVVEKIGTSSINSGCDIVKYIKRLPGGEASKIKKSTLFPRGWSKSNIIKAIEHVANNPATTILKSGCVFMKGQIRGVTIEVISRGSEIVSGYPL
jgi:hypothetical protein